MPERNWAGNHTYRAHVLHRPRSLAELQEAVSRARRIRVLGSRHSFSGIADSDELVTLDGLPQDVRVDEAAGTVTLSAAMRYGELATALAPHRLALANLASLPHISVAGAIATATHGSGDENGNLATAVAALEGVASSGERFRVARGEPDFDGIVVGLGALGVVTRVTLDVEPTYQVRQRVFEGLAWERLLEHFDEIMASGYSVSLLTRWTGEVEQVWVKTRAGDEPEEVRASLFGAAAATRERHPIAGNDPASCSPQLGVPGAWSDRLPHFRMGFTPSNGDELQSEYFVPRQAAAAALDVVRAAAQRFRPLLLVSEIRTVAADTLWLSPQHGRDSVAIHFTWKPQQEPVERALVELEERLTAFAARPHWGKLFAAGADRIAGLYERLEDYRRLAERLDGRGAFRNAWLERRVLGG